MLAWVIFEYPLLERYARTLTWRQWVPLFCRAYLVIAFLASVLYLAGIGLIVGLDLPTRFPEAYTPEIQKVFASHRDSTTRARIGIEETASKLALGLAMGLARNLAGRLALGLAWGLAAGLGLAGGLAAGLAMGLAMGPITDLVGGLAVGLVVGLAAGLAGGLTGEGDLAISLVVGVVFIVGYTVGFLRLPFYPWHVFGSAFRADFYCNPYLRDRVIVLPLPGLSARLTTLAEEDPETARRFIAFLLEYRPLQRGLAMYLTHAATAGEWRQHVLDPDHLLPPELVAEETGLLPSRDWLAALRGLAAELRSSKLQSHIGLKKEAFERFAKGLDGFREQTLREPYRWHRYYLGAIDLWREEAYRLVCRKLVDIANREGRSDLSPRDLDEALAEAIDRETSVFTVFWNQFCRQRNCRETVERILSGEPPADKRAVLQLEEHGYVVNKAGEWRLRVPLFDTWLRRYKDAFA